MAPNNAARGALFLAALSAVAGVALMGIDFGAEFMKVRNRYRHVASAVLVLFPASL